MKHPLPEFWPFGRFRGHRIDALPTGYIAWQLRHPYLPPRLRAALVAETGLRVMANDQREGF